MRRLPEAFLHTTQGSRLRVKGQATVEFALVAPILLFMILGIMEGAILASTQHTIQNSVDVLAQVASKKIEAVDTDSWEALVTEQISRTSRCAEPPVITIIYPDTTKESGDRVKISWSCSYSPLVTNGLWPGLKIGAESEAVINLEPEPIPLPSVLPSAPSLSE